MMFSLLPNKYNVISLLNYPQECVLLANGVVHICA